MEWGIKQGSKLKELRIRKGFTQDYVAKKISVNRLSVMNWETGKTTPRDKALHDMAFLYNVTVEEITGEDVETPEPEPERNYAGPYQLIQLLAELTGKSDAEIMTAAINEYAKTFNWYACIKQKYLDETDQLN